MNSGYLHFPEFDPVIFSVGPVALHWYGLMYLVGFVFAMWLAGRRAKRPGSGWTKDEVENLLYAGFLGVFLGGRIGYVLFYNFPVFLNDPLYLFRVWDGGMSFHGGLIGVILVMVIFAKRTKRSFFQVSDFIAPLIPFGLGAGARHADSCVWRLAVAGQGAPRFCRRATGHRAGYRPRP